MLQSLLPDPLEQAVVVRVALVVVAAAVAVAAVVVVAAAVVVCEAVRPAVANARESLNIFQSVSTDFRTRRTIDCGD